MFNILFTWKHRLTVRYDVIRFSFINLIVEIFSLGPRGNQYSQSNTWNILRINERFPLDSLVKCSPRLHSWKSMHKGVSSHQIAHQQWALRIAFPFLSYSMMKLLSIDALENEVPFYVNHIHPRPQVGQGRFPCITDCPWCSCCS